MEKRQIPDRDIYCKRCGREEIYLEKNCEFHHVIPICCGGVDLDGRRYLCINCHNIIHKMINGILWKFVVDKEAARKAIFSKTREELHYDPKPIMPP